MSNSTKKNSTSVSMDRSAWEALLVELVAIRESLDTDDASKEQVDRYDRVLAWEHLIRTSLARSAT